VAMVGTRETRRRGRLLPPARLNTTRRPTLACTRAEATTRWGCASSLFLFFLLTLTGVSLQAAPEEAYAEEAYAEEGYAEEGVRPIHCISSS
jgi:hypothetical protein